MDDNYNEVMSKKIQRALDNLKKNNMEAYYVNTCADALELVKSLCPKGQTVSSGGSQTLKESGVMDLLRSGDYKFLDREAPGANKDEIYHKAFSCDTYFMSSNAITENGELYNVDGNSNRVAALMYGPKSVIVLAGYNKIVRNISAAIQRVREVAAPANAVRLKSKVPCTQAGICCDCKSDERICCNMVISGFQRVAGRVKVIVIGEPLGY